jgi:hypothetical protein
VLSQWGDSRKPKKIPGEEEKFCAIMANSTAENGRASAAIRREKIDLCFFKAALQ